MSRDVSGTQTLLMFFVGLPLMMFLGWFAGGLVVSTFWDWFVIPVFQPLVTLPSIGILQGAGLMMAMSEITGTYSLSTQVGKLKKAKEEEHPFLNGILTIVVVNAILLFLGWCLHLFM